MKKSNYFCMILVWLPLSLLTITCPAKAIKSGPIVNINTADVATLLTLQGVGKVRAQAIVDYRQQHGEFKTPQDLANVKGIGTKGAERLLKTNPNRVITQLKKLTLITYHPQRFLL